MALFKSCTAWISQNKASTHDGVLMIAIGKFINTGVANIIQAPFIGVTLEDTMVIINDCGQCDSRSCACSNITGDQIDCAGNTSLQQKAVKVKEVNLGSFGHGFGLREDDIILTVNDKRVESTDMAIFLVNQCIAGANKNSKLALEIQRIERGLIRLDNLGDEIELNEIEDADLICISYPNQLTTYRLKNLRFRKYLTVKRGNICLSRRTTAVVETHFIICQYQRRQGEIELDRFVMLQHKTSGQCIFVENGDLILKDQPNEIIHLPRNSGFLFNLKDSSDSTRPHALYIETVTSSQMAIGFERRTGKAVLLHASTDKKVLFNVFEDNRH